jgi:hypothetical protein
MASAPTLFDQPLEFEKESHVYRVGREVLPSVTQILSLVRIIDYDHIPPYTRRMALDRGSWVHEATAMDDRGELSIDPWHDWYGYIEAWRNWREHQKFDPDFIEQRDYHRQFRYAGTKDRYHSQQRRLVDLKTNNAPWWTRIQTAAYAAFLDDPMTIRRTAVELHPDGSYSWQDFRVSDWHEDFNTFLAALRVFREREAHSEEYR